MLPPDSEKEKLVAGTGGSQDGTPLLDLRRLAGTLLGRWRLIAGTVAGTLLLALAYVLVAPPTFTATAIVLVDPREVRLTEANEVLSGIGKDSAAITSQLAVLRSRELLMPVLEREGVFTDPEFVEEGDTPDAVFETVQKKLSVERQGLTYVIEVGFKSKSAEKSARLVNAIVNAYVSDQAGEKSRATVQATGLLTDQIAGLRDSVAKAEVAVETFKAQNGILDIETGRTLLQSQIDKMNGQVLEARERARLAQSRYAQAKKLENTPAALTLNADILTSPTADDLREQYNTKSVERSRLGLIYGARHPQLVTLDSQLAQLTALMKAETARIVRRLDNQVQLAQDDADKAEDDLAALRASADTIGQKEVELRQLQLQAQTSREVLQQFLRRAQETSQLDRMQRADARIISAAVPPSEPTWPKPKLIGAVALLFGAFAGTALALLLGPVVPLASGTSPDRSGPADGWRRTPPTDGGRAGGQRLPVLGTVRSSVALYPAGQGGFASGALMRARTELEESLTGAFGKDVRAILRGSLDLLPTEDGPHLVAFTSLGDRAGKYRMAYNMGLALRQAGASVLVVDLDPLEQPSRFAGEADLFAELSARTPPSADRLVDPVTRLPVLKAHGLRSGGPDFGEEAAGMLLDWAADQFDFVLVNALPWQAGERQEGLLAFPALLAFVVSEFEADEMGELEAGTEFGDPFVPCCIVMQPTIHAPQQAAQAEFDRHRGSSAARRAG